MNPPKTLKLKGSMNQETEVLDGEMDEEEVIPTARATSNKLGDVNELKFSILGMMRGKDKSFYFKIR